MASVKVRFVYQVGIKRPLFSNVRLVGSWDQQGRYSPGSWSESEMMPIQDENECASFETNVELQIDDFNQDSSFHWGVLLDGPAGRNQWGIMTEISEINPYTKRIRYVQLNAVPMEGVREQIYYLTYNRRLGANKFFALGSDKPAIRFAVWAPNAVRVETVIGSTWDDGDTGKKPLEGLPQSDRSIKRERIMGGYIADNGQGSHPTLGPFPMIRQADNVWATDPSDRRLLDFREFDHMPYMFRITKDDGQVVYRTDIYSRCQIGAGKFNPKGSAYSGRLLDFDGSVSCSAVIDPDQVTALFDEPRYPETNWVGADVFWSDEYRDDRPVPQHLDDLIIYELHLGALGFPRNDPGTIQDALDLLDYLEELGINAIELLPMAEFGGGAQNWGYATSHYYAIEYGGGGRDKFKYLVRECHRRGIAVIMDVVYNHYVHNGERSQWLYDTNDHRKNPYYWYEGSPVDYEEFNRVVVATRRGTGGYIDNLSTGWAPRYHEEIVRKMFSSMAVALVDEFHVDGFRVDQTTSIHAYNVLHANGESIAAANIFGAKMLREWSRTQKFIRPNVFLMAEDHSEWDMVTRHPDDDGLGFDATWFADFYHHLVGDGEGHEGHAKLLKNSGDGDDRPLRMDLFANALAASGHGRVVYNESHDEAGNGSSSARNILIAANHAPLVGETRRYAEARCRFVFGVTLFSAGCPLFLFGEEVGTDRPFLYDRVLEFKEDLNGMRRGLGRYMFDFYREAIQLRRSNPGLRSRNIDVLHVHNENRVIAFRRWSDGQEFIVIGSLNNRPFASGYAVQSDLIVDGRWKILINSDSPDYGGDGIGCQMVEQFVTYNRLNVELPANGIIVLQRILS